MECGLTRERDVKCGLTREIYEVRTDERET